VHDTPGRGALRHRLRTSLGRPASRSVVVWAVLTAVICGVFAAAFATRAGWETARPLPRAAETRDMLGEILPGQEFTGIQDPPAMFVFYGEPLGWDAAHGMLLGDGGEYEQAQIGGSVAGPSKVPVPETVELVSRNLRAYGWMVYPTVRNNMYDCVGPPCDPATIPQSTTIVARRGDTTFSMEVNPPFGTSTAITAGFGRATPIAVYPFGLAGGVLSATVAFLVFGWAGRRTEARHPARAVVKVLLGMSLFFWWVPTLVSLLSMAEHHLDEPHPSWHPMWEWLGQPAFSLLFLIGCGSALLGLALAALPARRREPLATVATV
jgi:hypothetical protein